MVSNHISSTWSKLYQSFLNRLSLLMKKAWKMCSIKIALEHDVLIIACAADLSCLRCHWRILILSIFSFYFCIAHKTDYFFGHKIDHFAQLKKCEIFVIFFGVARVFPASLNCACVSKPEPIALEKMGVMSTFL